MTLSAKASAPALISPSTNSSNSGVPRNWSEGTLSPETIMLVAYSRPSSRGRRCVPPAPGSRPIFTSGSATCVPAATTRKWQPSANSRPPPMQMPWIAAITGLAAPSATAITVRSEGSANIFGVPNSLMSAPLENTLPAPITTIALIAGSASARSIAPTTCARTA
jgi:hypothetical protein